MFTDGSRNDWIRAGSFPLNSPNLTFSIVRQTKAKPLTVSLTRNLEDIAEVRLVRHTYRPGYYALSTRLGELRGVRFDVNADGIRKYCLGFHKPVSNLVFVKGYVCLTRILRHRPGPRGVSRGSDSLYSADRRDGSECKYRARRSQTMWSGGDRVFKRCGQ